ncbi:MAG: hypothetical protein ABL989_11040 [Gammaproteobacteria bacterium]
MKPASRITQLFNAMKAAIAGMPTGLALITLGCLAFSVFAPVSLLPVGTYRIDGVPVSFADFWRRGGGPLEFSLGVVCGSLAYGFIRARRWSRPLFVLAMALLALPGALSGPAQTEALVTGICLSGLAYWYVFHRRTVRQYFSADSQDS